MQNIRLLTTQPSADFMAFKEVSMSFVDLFLVGGWVSTHLKNMRKSNRMISPGRDNENKRYLKPPPRFLNVNLSLSPGVFSTNPLCSPGGKSGGGARGGCTEPLAWPTKFDALFQAFGFLSSIGESFSWWVPGVPGTCPVGKCWLLGSMGYNFFSPIYPNL